MGPVARLALPVGLVTGCVLLVGVVTGFVMPVGVVTCFVMPTGVEVPSNWAAEGVLRHMKPSGGVSPACRTLVCRNSPVDTRDYGPILARRTLVWRSFAR